MGGKVPPGKVFEMTKPALGVVTEAAAKAINPAFVAAVKKADGKPWDIEGKGVVRLDPCEHKKGEMFLIFDYAPGRALGAPRQFQVVKIVGLNVASEAVTVNNGVASWRCTPTGVKL